MKIIEIEPGILYSVWYDHEIYDEYNRIFESYSDFTYTLDFFNKYNLRINDFYVSATGIPRTDPEGYAEKVVTECLELEERFENLVDNVKDGLTPDFHEEFQWLEGTPGFPLTGLKWGKIDSASMLRIYAVEVESNCLIIVYGGIKISHKLSECPMLETAVRKVQDLIFYLRQNDATTISDFKDLINKKRDGDE
ncbi:MAG: hypothetical protein HDS23_03440 [Bacteroides sp.]|nr:hypothetical protein [Bacteroides sp.]MBD5339778.1 hypothetical protein [Bacteroides sp.]